MGWQNLSSSLRLWDKSSKAISEVEAAAEELLASGNDAEALQIFSEALDPSLQRGTDFLKRLAQTEGAKCRCDAVWYGDTIAYGCKTCGLSSASCICVFCFDAGDHEGHDFYISRSDYGCCDCGDVYAWRQSGFCRHHPGPRDEADPAQLLPEVTRRRAQLLIPAQVRRLVNFHPSVLPGVPPPPAPYGAYGARRAQRVKGTDGTDSGRREVPPPEEEEDDTHRVLVTGINLRVTEEQLKEFLDTKLGLAAPEVLSFKLERDEETKTSKGRAVVLMFSEVGVTALTHLSGESLRGSPLRMHTGAEIAVAKKHLQALETNFEWLLSLGGFHDGLRKIIGQVFLDKKLLGQAENAVEVLLRLSHLMEPSVRKLETNLMVDLMLDLDFKHRFAQVFTSLYQELVQNREGNQDTNELGDFTCQIFTRQDVTLQLVRERDLLKTLLGSLWGLLKPTLLAGAHPPVFNHESNTFRDHEIIQCSMDLLYVLDHAEVVREIITSPRLRSELWEGWIRILISMQAMNPHKRRSGTHVEFTNPSWGNALTLHTDLMSNTWLILDAVETKADVEAVKEMARVAWRELRAWMVQAHVAEGRVGQTAMETIDYQVANGTSFHLPVNRVLAFLIHQLCLRSSGESVQQVLQSVGMAESDTHWWMEHPLRALVLQSQVMAGMWRRNGEALEHESEFYRMNYWHHLLIDADLLVMRLSTLSVRPEGFLSIALKRFELWSWLQPGDPMARLSGEDKTDPFALQKLQSFVLFLYQLLSGTALSLSWAQLVTHTTRQFLAVGPRSHSQLWDPRVERSTATAMAKDQQMLEATLREISDFRQADGHAPAKYHLKDTQWFGVDPYFHLFSWSEQQKVEENFVSALKAQGHDLEDWAQSPQPAVREVYRGAFARWTSSGIVQAFCWLLLVRMAFDKQDQDGDGRLLVLSLLACRAMLVEPQELGEDNTEAPMEVDLPKDEVQLFWLAKAMGPHLCVSATRKFSIKVKEEVVEVSLMDAVERLAMARDLSGSLARGLRKLLQRQALRQQVPRQMDESPEEDRRAKRRKAAQERQQRMLENLRKRQAAFISEAGEKYEALASDTASPEETASPDCVVCMSHQEGDPLGLICFLRPAVASSLPRRRVATEQAVLLQPPRTPLAENFRSRPQCFDPQAPDGLVLARACSHRMHFSCWGRFQTAVNASGGRAACPYCGTVTNALLPVMGSRDTRPPGDEMDLEAGPRPRRQAEASEEFLTAVEGQMSRLGRRSEVAEAVGLGTAPSHPFLSLSKLFADNVAMAEVRAATRDAAASSSARPGVAQAAHASVLAGILEEALDASPPSVQPISQASDGKLAGMLLRASPHTRFEMLTVLLISLCKSSALGLGRQLIYGFYLLEAVILLTALADTSLVEAQARRAPGIWHWVQRLSSCSSSSTPLTPIHSLEEATEVLRLALNPFLYKVRLLLSFLSPEEFPFSGGAEDHLRLEALPDVEELLQSPELAALAQLMGDVDVSSLRLRGHQPASPVLLVLVGDPVDEVPFHVWQMPPSGFERLRASCQDVVELSSHNLPGNGRLFCVSYRLSLPVITGNVYQKFYTQFVHARCTVCKTSSSIPTLCLLCGTFLCCNSECCRREVDGQLMGEVTQHAQVCGFGTCVFLQLSNSLVHIVADGFITCWGSLYLDGHGEEEYNLARPLHISEVRLQQLTKMIREVSFDFESRLKWKRIILV